MKNKRIIGVLFLIVISVFLLGNNRAPLVKEIKSHILYLSSITPARTWKNIESLNQAAEYIFNEFKENTNGVRYQIYQARHKKYKNIIATFGPLDKKRIILGAHYDVCTPQPGADDNASGVASLIELSRLLGNSYLINHPYRIDLVAYPLEEPPFFRSKFMGSAIHAKSLKKMNQKVLVMISIDMIGYFSKGVPPSSHISPFTEHLKLEKGTITTLIGRKSEKRILAKILNLIQEKSQVKLIGLPVEGTFIGYDWSDHLNYWSNGFPALFISNYFLCPNPYYHTPLDTIEWIDCHKIAQITLGLYNFLMKIK